MASGLFALLDDIALLADDVAVASKMATKKTAGLLGDDLAVNAGQATGFEQNRELKILWAITKGSLLNKLIILPFAFLLSAFAPFVIPYILILGGFYLLYEGAEKIEEFFHKEHPVKKENPILQSTSENVLEIENKKIKDAIFTDFILSVEIVMVALGTVMEKQLLVQIFSVSFVAVVATIFVYGLVAMIVRMDNVGFWLIKKERVRCGIFLISLMPKIISTLSVVGTFAMIVVGGGILAHNIEPIHHLFIETLPSLANELLVGIVFGIITLVVVNTIKKLFNIKESF